MSLENKIVTMAEAIGADVRELKRDKVDKVSGKGLSDTNFTQAEKTKLAGVAVAATKNRADTLNADKVHTHTTAQITGLDTALAGKASTSDSRFTDAREWSAATITQAEVEEGTATTRRAFTAQRVRQAIVSWFNGISGELGRTILTRTTAAQVRADIGLGTAATMDVVQESGTSSEAIMSQEAVTGQLDTKVDKVAGKVLSDTNFTQVEKTKLAGVANGATANRSDSLNADKVHTHTTTQVVGLDTALENKVDKVAGKGLSASDYTAAEKTKLSGIATGATKNRADSANADKIHKHVTADVTGLDAALLTKFDKADIEQATGTATDKVMSQKAVTEAIAAASGGGGGVQIDDNAGIGDTDVTWSADKTVKEIKVATDELQLGTAATTDNGTGFGQNIINSAVSGLGNISYSGTLQSNTTGHSNTAAGNGALQSNTTGYSNTAAGNGALQSNTTGHSNTAAGNGALLNNKIGYRNTAAGTRALLNGYNYENCGGFGYNSQVTASNQIQLGDSSTTVYAYGAIQNRSDARDKTEIRDTVLGLDFINAIRPVDYKLDMREDYRVELGNNPTKEQLEANKLANIQADGTHTRKRYHHGVIAQQVAETMEALGVDFGGFQDHSKIGGDDVLSIGYEEFIAPLIKAVQELSARVKELEIKVEHEKLDDETITRNQE